MDFDDLRKANSRRDQESYPLRDEWTLSDWGVALAGEVGEACNLIKRMRRGDYIPSELIMNEIADVIIYADLLAISLGESLQDAVIRKFNDTSNIIGSKVKLTREYHAPINVANFSPPGGIQGDKVSDASEDVNPIQIWQSAWKAALSYLNDRKRERAVEGLIGSQSIIKSIYPLEHRYANGERSDRLFDAVMAVQRFPETFTQEELDEAANELSTVHLRSQLYDPAEKDD